MEEGLQSLPIEVLMHIFGSIDIIDLEYLYYISLVCKEWRTLAFDTSLIRELSLEDEAPWYVMRLATISGENLRELNLSNCSFLNDDHIEKVLSVCTDIISLNISNCSSLTCVKTFKSLCDHCNYIQDLSIANIGFTASQLNTILRKYPELRRLDISGWKRAPKKTTFKGVSLTKLHTLIANSVMHLEKFPNMSTVAPAIEKIEIGGIRSIYYFIYKLNSSSLLDVSCEYPPSLGSYRRCMSPEDFKNLLPLIPNATGIDLCISDVINQVDIFKKTIAHQLKRLRLFPKVQYTLVGEQVSAIIPLATNLVKLIIDSVVFPTAPALFKVLDECGGIKSLTLRSVTVTTMDIPGGTKTNIENLEELIIDRLTGDADILYFIRELIESTGKLKTISMLHLKDERIRYLSAYVNVNIPFLETLVKTNPMLRTFHLDSLAYDNTAVTSFLERNNIKVIKPKK